MDIYYAFLTSSDRLAYISCSFSLPSYLKIVKSSWMSLQLLAIFSAVSILSPVNIHTLIFARIRSRIVYGTSSCSLSSTAVAPIRNSPFSSSSTIRLNFYDRPSVGSSFTFFRNDWYSCSEIVRMPTSNVRRPILENSLSSLLRFSYDFCDRRLITILSAPFVYILMRPFSLMMMLIRFLSELKGNSSRSYTVFYCPLILIVVCCLVLLMN